MYQFYCNSVHKLCIIGKIDKCDEIDQLSVPSKIYKIRYKPVWDERSHEMNHCVQDFVKCQYVTKEKPKLTRSLISWMKQIFHEYYIVFVIVTNVWNSLNSVIQRGYFSQNPLTNKKKTRIIHPIQRTI